jgi:hypothetical protein
VISNAGSDDRLSLGPQSMSIDEIHSEPIGVNEHQIAIFFGDQGDRPRPIVLGAGVDGLRGNTYPQADIPIPF